MNSFPVADVLAACRQYGGFLHAPAGLDGVKILTALAAAESGGGDVKAVGHDCGPRHEPAYDVGGKVYKTSTLQQELVTRHGAAAACSYGPWQLMFMNYPGCTPDQLLHDLPALIEGAVDYFNRYDIGCRKAKNLAEIGEVWNTGSVKADPVYVAELQAAYDAA
jgi:hypothetical protein